jgi:hypothetical protein
MQTTVWEECEREVTRIHGEDRDSAKDRRFLLGVSLHLADISNCSRSWPFAREATKRLCLEYWIQGDMEQELGVFYNSK